MVICQPDNFSIAVFGLMFMTRGHTQCSEKEGYVTDER
jgi:hypothetical protein